MKRRRFQYVWQILGGILFVLLPVFASLDYDGNQTFIPPKSLRDSFLFFLLLLFFYVFYLWLIPKFYFKTGKGAFFLWTVAFLLLFSFANRVFLEEGFQHHLRTDHFRRDGSGPHGFMGPQRGGPMRPGPFRWQDSVWFDAFIFLKVNLAPFLFPLFLAIALRVRHQLKQSEQEKLTMELDLLKAQINPHFLFNTLNGIYALALEKSDLTPVAVQKLSAMMRYVITEAHAEMVPLAQEVRYLEDYIDLQKMRFGDTISCRFEVKGSAEGRVIAPMLLIPFIENAFKYGADAEQGPAIRISLTLEEKFLELEVENAVSDSAELHPHKHGTGIRNVKNRLALLYPGRHDLSITNEGKVFLVKLQLTET